MINLVYIAFLYALVGEVVIFLLLTLPTPQSWKSKLAYAFMGSNLRSSLMWVHFAMCVFAGIFFFELVQEEIGYVSEIEKLRQEATGQVGAGNLFNLFQK